MIQYPLFTELVAYFWIWHAGWITHPDLLIKILCFPLGHYLIHFLHILNWDAFCLRVAISLKPINWVFPTLSEDLVLVFVILGNGCLGHSLGGLYVHCKSRLLSKPTVRGWNHPFLDRMFNLLKKKSHLYWHIQYFESYITEKVSP